MECGKNEKTYHLTYVGPASELTEEMVTTAAQGYLQGQVRVIRYAVEYSKTHQAFDADGKRFTLYLQHLLVHYENC